MDDYDLLRAYVDAGSETAFSELVRRHLDMVYSVAWRRLNDVQAAREVAQAVFCLLAQKARKLPPNAPPGAWLYQVACYKSAEFARAEFRRRTREQQAMEMPQIAAPAEAAWDELAPLLDDAVSHLNLVDRQAVVLRFFERKSWREVGSALRLDEDAARKRVHRALDKLRAWFAKKGVTCSAGALGVALWANAVQSAPAGIAAALAKTALAAGAAAATPWLPALFTHLIPDLMKKTVLIAVGSALVVPSIVLWQQNRDLRRELTQVRAAAADFDRLRDENATLWRSQIDTNEISRLRANQSELLRLRGEATRLRKQLAARLTPDTADRAIAGSADEPVTRTFSTSLTARIPSGQTLVVGGWTNGPGKRSLAMVVPTVIGAANESKQITVTTTLVEMPEAVWSQLGLSQPNANGPAVAPPVYNGDEAQRFFSQLTNNPGVQVLSAPRITQLDGIPARISTTDANTGASQTVDLTSHPSSDGQQVDLRMNLELTSSSSPDATGTNGNP